MVLKRRVVDEDVEFAELLDCLFDELAANLRRANVAHHRICTTSFGFDRAFRFVSVSLFLFQERERDVGAFAREEYSDCAADTGIGAGDQRDLVFQFVRAGVVRRFVARFGIEFVLLARLWLMLWRHRRLRLFETALMSTITTLRR